MLASGTLKSGDPYELLEGWIVQKMSRNAPHDVTLDIVHEALRDAVPVGWRVRVQSAVTIDDSEPEPDLAVVRGPAQRYYTNHPSPSDIALLVEVADSSLQHDRLVKGRIYARAGIPAYWIVNLIDMQVEVYSNPTGDVAEPDYRQRTEYRAGQSVPLVIDGAPLDAIAVDSLLP
jgi:Uma2 family endonuclease